MGSQSTVKAAVAGDAGGDARTTLGIIPASRDIG